MRQTLAAVVGAVAVVGVGVVVVGVVVAAVVGVVVDWWHEEQGCVHWERCAFIGRDRAAALLFMLRVVYWVCVLVALLASQLLANDLGAGCEPDCHGCE